MAETRAMTGWAGWVAFAAFVLILNGAFDIIQGLVAVIGPGAYYTVVNGSLFLFDVTGWGWWSLIIGALQVLTGIAILGGARWGRIVAIIVAAFSALGHLLLVPAAPWWSVIGIALNVLVIFALAVHGREVGGSAEA